MLRNNLLRKTGTAFITAAIISSVAGTSLFAAENGAGAPPEKPAAESSGDMTPPDGQGGPGGNGQGGPGGDGQGVPGSETMSGNGAPGGAPGGMPGGGGQTAVTEWDSVKEINSDTTEDDLSVESTGTDENAVHVTNGALAVFHDLVLSRKSSDSQGGDSSSFYGVGAAFLNTDGTAVIDGADITTESGGGAGIFSYGDGVTYVRDAVIDTTEGTSGGIHVAGGGTLYAWDVTAETDGASSAAIRSDRGGGKMVVDGGTYTSNGEGSPALYCTADITVNNAELTANGSEGICLEGLNTTRLFDCDLTSNMPDLDQNNGNTWSVILYQSMSGDSEVGKGEFDMVGGSITSNNGGLFYTTNTESEFYLNDVDITTADDCEYFLRATGNDNQRGWGTSGANGADCTFTADSQDCEGDVIYDSISSLDFYLLNGSTLTGRFYDDESCAGDGGNKAAVLTIDADSSWIVTGDSEVTSLHNAGTIEDEEGNTVTIKGTDGTVYVEGDSEYTVTAGSYDTEADTSNASTAPQWSDYEVNDEITAKYLSADTETVSETSSDTDSSDMSASAPEETSAVTAEKTQPSGMAAVIIAAGAAIAAAIAGFFILKNRR